LLGENVHRGIWNGDAVQIALPDGANERSILEKIVAGGSEEAPFRNRSPPMACATYALQTDGDRTRRPDLADEVDAANINSEFERGRSD
jgi:hypothetical protein